MITGQLSKPLLSLRSDMSAAELRADDKAATPDSDLNDEPLLLPSDATDREGTPNKLYGEYAHASHPDFQLTFSQGFASGIRKEETQNLLSWDRCQKCRSTNLLEES